MSAHHALRRTHHTALTAAVQRAALECQELGSGCLLVAASALQQEVEDLLAQVGMRPPPPAPSGNWDHDNGCNHNHGNINSSGKDNDGIYR